jgi:hypothetical protein
MSLILVIIINLILIFIAFVALNSRIKKNSAFAQIERYTKEVENLIVQLNAAVDDVVNVAEDRIDELKGVIARAEKLLKNPKLGRVLSTQRKEKSEGVSPATGEKETQNLMEKTKHLLSMGHSKGEIAKLMKINRAEVDFLESLSKK